MEFLQENSAMQKIKNGLKDIKDVTPFINLFDTSFKGWYNPVFDTFFDDKSRKG